MHRILSCVTRISLSLLFAMLLGAAPAQDTTWFDDEWRTCDAARADYYRVQNGAYLADYYASGQLQFEATLADTTDVNSYQGVATWYYESGRRQIKAGFVNGRRHGVEKTWFENGQLKSEGKYVLGKQEGPHRKWDPAGVLQEVAYFTSGAPTPVYEYRDHFGHWQMEVNGIKLWEEGRNVIPLPVPTRADGKLTKPPTVAFKVKNGKLNGKYLYTDADGVVTQKGKFKNNLFEGRWYGPEMDGVKQYTDFKAGFANGLRLSASHRYEWGADRHEVTLARMFDGEVVQEVSVQAGFSQELSDFKLKQKGDAMVAWFPNGKMAARSTFQYAYGEPIAGELERWSVAGVRIEHQQIRPDGSLVVKRWYQDGSVRDEVVLKEGVRKVMTSVGRDGTQFVTDGNGTERLYHVLTLFKEIQWENGLQHGTVKTYWPNGKVQLLEHWKEGKRHGQYIHYKENGIAVERLTYANDEVNGLFVQYWPNGEKRYEGTRVGKDFTGAFFEYYVDGSASRHWEIVDLERRRLIAAWDTTGQALVENGDGEIKTYLDLAEFGMEGDPILKIHDIYKDGWLVHSRTYHTNGDLANDRRYRDGRLVKHLFYREGHQLSRRALHTSDSTHTVTYYGEDGNVRQEEEYRYDQKVSAIHYYPGGKPKEVIEWLGEREFLMSYWDQKSGKQLVRNGAGKFRKTSFTGDVLEEGLYVDGLRHGTWKVRKMVTDEFEEVQYNYGTIVTE